MAWTVRSVGTGTPVISASSTTAASSTSSSSGLPRSRSWSVEVRWSPTRSAPARRRSTEMSGRRAQRPGDGERLGHHDLDDPARAPVQTHLPHGRPGQRADRVERDVAEQLDPDVAAQFGLDGALEAPVLHRPAEREAPVRHRAVGLPDGEPGSFEMAYDTWAFELRRRVDDTADGPLGREHRTDRAARVHALDTLPVVRAAVPVEVPPGDAVLGRDHGRRAVQQGLDERPARRVRVCLEAEEDIVDRADPRGVVGRVHPGGEVTAGAAYLDAVLPHGREVRSTGYEMHVGSRRGAARLRRRRRSHRRRGLRLSRWRAPFGRGLLLSREESAEDRRTVDGILSTVWKMGRQEVAHRIPCTDSGACSSQLPYGSLTFGIMRPPSRHPAGAAGSFRPPLCPSISPSARPTPGVSSSPRLSPPCTSAAPRAPSPSSSAS